MKRTFDLSIDSRTVVLASVEQGKGIKIAFSPTGVAKLTANVLLSGKEETRDIVLSSMLSDIENLQYMEMDNELEEFAGLPFEEQCMKVFEELHEFAEKFCLRLSVIDSK